MSPIFLYDLILKFPFFNAFGEAIGSRRVLLVYFRYSCLLYSSPLIAFTLLHWYNLFLLADFILILDFDWLGYNIPFYFVILGDANLLSGYWASILTVFLLFFILFSDGRRLNFGDYSSLACGRIVLISFNALGHLRGLINYTFPYKLTSFLNIESLFSKIGLSNNYAADGLSENSTVKHIRINVRISSE